MKTQGGKCHNSLELLFHLATLREDCCFFSKLLLYEWDKKLSPKFAHQLSLLEQERVQQ